MDTKKKFDIKRTIGILFLAIVIVYSGIYYVQFFVEIDKIHGTYESVDADTKEPNSQYELTITKFGNFELTELRSGDMLMEGKLTKTPAENYTFTLKCGYDADYQGEKFLDMESRINRVKIYPDTQNEKQGIFVKNDVGKVCFVVKK